jgi:hypothetical protein
MNKNAMIARTATPATLPPAIAPALGLLSSDAVGGAGGESFGMATGAFVCILVGSGVTISIPPEGVGDSVEFNSLGDTVGALLGKGDSGEVVRGGDVGADGVTGTGTKEKHPSRDSLIQAVSVITETLDRTCVFVDNDPAGNVAICPHV